MGTRGRIGILITFACASALACAQAVEAGPDASPARFNVTLTGQVTKSWDYVTTRVEGECTVATHVVGNRVVTLRSFRPTIVSATSRAGRVRFSPAVVRSVTARTTQGGSMTTTERGPGCGRRTHTTCPKRRRTLANQTLAFFRSGRNEISFRRARDFGSGLSTSCPLEAAEVRVERPGLHQAQGEVSEQDLFNRGIRFQTATGSSEETSQLSGNPDGKVVARASWSLTFRRR
ncbi:MAG: hypothetical protein ACRDKK_07600 [Gaiellaceae bacterium]